MFSADHKLRHLPFFEELAAHEELTPEWRNASAGLIILRLIDDWFANGTRLVASDDPSIASARSLLAELDAQPQVQAALHSVLDALLASGSIESVGPRLLTYGHLLEYDAKWGLAADVFSSLVGHCDPIAEHDLATQASIRLGYCLHQLGSLAESLAAYRVAGAIAARSGDLVGILRARIGEAKAAITRGNMPQAQAILDDTVDQAAKAQLTEVQSMALHDRAMVAYLTGDHELAVQLSYRALEMTQSPRSRDRLLGDIASTLNELGVRSGARDAFLILAATAQEQYSRWFANLNLMELAVADGEEIAFETYRRSIDPAVLPPTLRVQYWRSAALGLVAFGRPELAMVMLQRALNYAEAHEMNQSAFEIEALMTTQRIQTRAPEPPALVGDAVQKVLDSLRAQRELIPMT